MAGKKDTKLRASPCDRTEKNKEKSSKGTKNTPGGSGQGTAREMQQQPREGQEEEESSREDSMDSEEAVGEVQWTEEERIAKLKASPCDRTEKSKEKIKSSAGTC